MAQGVLPSPKSLFSLAAASVLDNIEDFNVEENETVSLLAKSIELIWDQLKFQSCFHLRKIIFNIELQQPSAVNSPKSAIVFFKHLANKFHVPLNGSLVDPAYFNRMFEEEALQMIWEKKLVSQLTFKRIYPRTLNGIQNWLNSPRHTVQLERIVKIELSNLGLKVIPPQLSRLSKLEFISIGCNQITTLPEWVGTLTSLRTLFVSDNEIGEIPDFLTRLSRLTQIFFSFNQVKTLPVSLGKLPQLTRLFVSYNQIGAIPDSFSHLTNLTDLYAGQNLISPVPNSLRTMTLLTDLYLGYNRLTEIPLFLENLPLLVELDLCHNLITAIPPFLTNLSYLRYLKLNGNRIGVIPDTLSHLRQLEDLNLSDNQIQRIPTSLGKLSNLESLRLSGNSICSLPEFLGDLSNLSQLEAYRNTIRGIPNSLVNLKHLEFLFLDHHQTSDKTRENPLLFLSEKKKLPRKTKDIISMGFTFNGYQSTSALAKFCQSLSFQDVIDQSEFNRLNQKDKELIYEMVSLIAGVQTEDFQWGKQHVFEDPNIFYHAVRKAISVKFERLAPFQKIQVSKKIAEATSNPLASDIKWAEYYLFDNVLLLIDAMAEVE